VIEAGPNIARSGAWRYDYASGKSSTIGNDTGHARLRRGFLLIRDASMEQSVQRPRGLHRPKGQLACVCIGHRNATAPCVSRRRRYRQYWDKNLLNHRVGGRAINRSIVSVRILTPAPLPRRRGTTSRFQRGLQRHELGRAGYPSGRTLPDHRRVQFCAVDLPGLFGRVDRGPWPRTRQPGGHAIQRCGHTRATSLADAFTLSAL
jgi:hypothetical protein